MTGPAKLGMLLHSFILSSTIQIIKMNRQVMSKLNDLDGSILYGMDD